MQKPPELTTDDTSTARELLSCLSAHLTSVGNVGIIRQLIADVRGAERERCARIADAFRAPSDAREWSPMLLASAIATKIRSDE